MPSLTREEIKEVLKEVISESHDDLIVERRQHYEDHSMIRSCLEHRDEMRLNHEFVSGVRKTSDQVKSITVKVGVTGFVTFVLYAIYHYAKESLK